MASYCDELKQENDHSIFVSLKMIILVEEPGLKNAKNKHLGMSPF